MSQPDSPEMFRVHVSWDKKLKGGKKRKKQWLGQKKRKEKREVRAK